MAKKLGIKPGHRVGLIGAPDAFEKTLAPLPADVTVATQARGTFDVVVFFVHRQSELSKRFGSLSRKISASGGIWIGWPKKASKVATDLSFEVVQHLGLAAGLVDNKVSAIDDTYSGLRFVVRIDNRAAWPPA